VKEVSQLFTVCPKTVRRWISAGIVPATRIGRDWRIARADLKAVAAARGNGAASYVL
jgi:excisionase family DNA binding protein